MNRDYELMRGILMLVSDSAAPLSFGGFLPLGDEAGLIRELSRLRDDGLIESTLVFRDGLPMCLGGDVGGLTDEGKRFLRLIENESAWAIMRKALDGAGVDVPYPLLKEVCEEVVKRYVTSFIPDIPPRR